MSEELIEQLYSMAETCAERIKDKKIKMVKRIVLHPKVFAYLRGHHSFNCLFSFGKNRQLYFDVFNCKVEINMYCSGVFIDAK